MGTGRKGSGVSEDTDIAAMRSLMAQQGIDSALIGVPKLARLLGMGASTLYAYIRAGTFFLPYRAVNGTPMVRVDDLIGWYRNPGCSAMVPSASADDRGGSERQAIIDPCGGPLAAAGSPPERKAGGARDGRSRSMRYELSDVASMEGAAIAVDGIVASVLARLERSRRKHLVSSE